jgi:hypothetical protein
MDVDSPFCPDPATTTGPPPATTVTPVQVAHCSPPPGLPSAQSDTAAPNQPSAAPSQPTAATSQPTAIATPAPDAATTPSQAAHASIGPLADALAPCMDEDALPITTAPLDVEDIALPLPPPWRSLIVEVHQAAAAVPSSALQRKVGGPGGDLRAKGCGRPAGDTNYGLGPPRGVDTDLRVSLDFCGACRIDRVSDRAPHPHPCQVPSCGPRPTLVDPRGLCPTLPVNSLWPRPVLPSNGAPVQVSHVRHPLMLRPLRPGGCVVKRAQRT